jgi:hypothetical protein
VGVEVGVGLSRCAGVGVGVGFYCLVGGLVAAGKSRFEILGNVDSDDSWAGGEAVWWRTGLVVGVNAGARSLEIRWGCEWPRAG